MGFVCLFVLMLYIPLTIFQLNRDGSSSAEPVLSQDKCVLLKDHNTVNVVGTQENRLNETVFLSTQSIC